MSFFFLYLHEKEGKRHDGEDDEEVEVPDPVSDVECRQRVKGNYKAIWPCTISEKEIPFNVHEYDEKNSDSIAKGMT